MSLDVLPSLPPQPPLGTAHAQVSMAFDSLRYSHYGASIMPAAIGLRFYKLFARRVRDREKETVDPAELNVTIPTLLTDFVSAHSEDAEVSDAEKERSYHFLPAESYGVGSVRGHISYGTFGFASRIRNPKKKSQVYNRQSDDVEDIPLYFDFWCPPKADFAMAALQSFGGKSCVHLVLHEMQKAFESRNPGYRLHTTKLMGNDSPQSLFADAPVKKLTFIKHNASSDSFGSYRKGKPPRPVDIELSYKAKRGGALGSLRDMGGTFTETDKGLVLFEGGELNEATAEVMVGKRRRPVGLIGPNSETGTIDVSETISYGADGHPTFESIRIQSNDILRDFYKRLTGA